MRYEPSFNSAVRKNIYAYTSLTKDAGEEVKDAENYNSQNSG
jgi:hypothetical protein